MEIGMEFHVAGEL